MRPCFPATLSDVTSVTEGSPATIALQCSGGDAGAVLVGVITSLPAAGTLSPVAADGTVGAALTAPDLPAYLASTTVLYETGVMGTELGVLPTAANSASYGSFTYACAVAGTAAGDTTCSVESAAAALVVAASHVNHAPTGCEGTACAAAGDAGADIAVTLTGADVDHDAPLTFSLTSLPAKGTRLVSGGGAVAAAGMAVPGGGGAVLYRALPGAQGAGDITFGYTVSDGVARSKEVGGSETKLTSQQAFPQSETARL